MGSSLCFSGSRSLGFPYFSLMRSHYPATRQTFRLAGGLRKIPRNKRVQPLQRVTRHSISPVPAKIELIKTLIEDEGTIGYEA